MVLYLFFKSVHNKKTIEFLFFSSNVFRFYMVLEQNWSLMGLLIYNLMEESLISYTKPFFFISIWSWNSFLSCLIIRYHSGWSCRSFPIWSWYLILYSFSSVYIYFSLWLFVVYFSWLVNEMIPFNLLIWDWIEKISYIRIVRWKNLERAKRCGVIL